MVPHQFHDLRGRRRPLVLLADHVQHRVILRRTALVDHGRLAATLEAGVEGQHAAARHRRLQQEIPEIAGEHVHRVRLAHVGHLPADLPLETGENQPPQGVAGAGLEHVGVRMPSGHEQFLRQRLHLVGRPLDPHFEEPGPLTPVDRQEPMGRHPLDVLAVVEVVAVVLLLLGEGLPFALYPLAFEVCRAVEDLAEPLPQIGPFAELVGDDVADAEEHIGGGGHLCIGVDEIGRPQVEVRSCGVGGEDFPSERLEFPLPCHLRGGELPRLEGKVEVFQLLRAVGGDDSRLEFGREPPLPLNRPQDRLLAIRELPGSGHSLGDQSDLLFVQTVGLITAIPRDEGNSVACVQQLDR